MRKTHSDEAIVAAFVTSKDDRLFEELHDRYQLKVYQSCLYLLHNSEEALDQTQEIFCKVYTRLYTFRAEAKFSTWLYVLTRYHCLSVLDTMKRQTFVSLDLLGEASGPFIQQEEPTLDERWNEAEQALQKLPVQDQYLLRRRYLANKDVATLAIEDRVSLSAMKMRLKRARDLARSYSQQCA